MMNLRDKVDTRELIKLLKMTQFEVKAYVMNFLFENGYRPISFDGGIVAVGDVKVALVAHMDTVFSPPTHIDYVNGVMSSKTGLGADDRAGVYTLLHIVSNGLRPTLLFMEDEEVGAIGARNLVQAGIELDLDYMVEIDRRGHKQAVYYECDNVEFEAFVTSFGFKTEIGLFSDISILAPYFGVSAVNVSAGYTGEHTLNEQLTIGHLAWTIKAVSKMIKISAVSKERFLYVERTYSQKYSKYGSYLNGKYDFYEKESNYGKSYQSTYSKSYSSRKSIPQESVLISTGIICFENGEMIEVDGCNDSYYMDEKNDIYTSSGQFMAGAWLADELNYGFVDYYDLITGGTKYE